MHTREKTKAGVSDWGFEIRSSWQVFQKIRNLQAFFPKSGKEEVFKQATLQRKLSK